MKKFTENDIFINKIKTHPKTRAVCYKGKIYIGSSLLPTLDDIIDNAILTEGNVFLLAEDGSYILLEQET